jgi:hypothetical protein
MRPFSRPDLVPPEMERPIAQLLHQPVLGFSKLTGEAGRYFSTSAEGLT